MHCPGCQSPAVEKRFEGVAGTPIPLDVCHACHGLWFDKTESLRLSPRGVLHLSRERLPFAKSMKCPRCQTPVSVLDASGVEALLQKQPEARRRALVAASSTLAVEATHASYPKDSVAMDLVEVGFEVLLEGLGGLIDL